MKCSISILFQNKDILISIDYTWSLWNYFSGLKHAVLLIQQLLEHSDKNYLHESFLGY